MGPRPETRPRKKTARRAVQGASLLALVFVAGSFAAPLLENRGSGRGALLRWAYAPLCHQMPERSLAIGPGTQAVCARCSGLYLGGVAGLMLGGSLVLATGRRLRPFWLGLALAPTMIDVLLPWVGLPDLPNLPRLLLALPAGFVAGHFLAIGIEDLVSSQETDPLPEEVVPTGSRAWRK